MRDRYVASLLRQAGCTDPQPLLGQRAWTSGRVAPRCRLCGVLGPSVADIFLETRDDVVHANGAFYESDEDVEAVERAYAAGTPVVTAPPRPLTYDELRAAPEGTVVRAVTDDFMALAWCVTTTGDWAVTGYESVWTTQHMFDVCERWHLVTRVATDDAVDDAADDDDDADDAAEES